MPEARVLRTQYVVSNRRRNGIMHLHDGRLYDPYGTTYCGVYMDFAGTYDLDDDDLPWRLCQRCEKERDKRG